MECVRYVFPAGSQAWLTAAKTPRLVCQQTCDALGRDKHRHFCSFKPKLRRNISALFCAPYRLESSFQILEGSFEVLIIKGASQYFWLQSLPHSICCEAYLIKKSFLNLHTGELQGMKIRQHSAEERNTCASRKVVTFTHTPVRKLLPNFSDSIWCLGRKGPCKIKRSQSSLTL